MQSRQSQTESPRKRAKSRELTSAAPAAVRSALKSARGHGTRLETPGDAGADPVAKDELDDIPLASPDEPLVASCRRYLTAGLPINDVLTTFLSDRTIRGICNRQAYRHRLSEADAAELLSELAILFYRKLLPRLQEPEKVWAVCALTAKRLAAGRGAKIRELPLEDMRHDSAERGAYDVDDHATAAADGLMLDRLGVEDYKSVETSVIARLDKERATKELAGLLQSQPLPLQTSDQPANDDLRRSIKFGPPGACHPGLCDPLHTSPLVSLMFDPDTILPTAPQDQPAWNSAVERMPKSYGALLIQIRDELGMTQKDLADALGISESSCAQYMAGAHGMPKDVWEEAVELKEQGAPRHRRLRELFESQPIKQILARWMNDVRRADPGLKVTYIEISRIMEVNKSTVTRWARDEQRPALARLGELEDALQRWIAKRKLNLKRRVGLR
jgi:transcriptional regulator with XRE-family HTH domain